MRNAVPVEILAPAGSFDSMKAAVAAGADAVYIGGSRFGARAYADNPEEDRLLEAIDYVHIHGLRLYMTVNTLMKEEELLELPDYLEPYYVRGVDAVIVQDMGAFASIRSHFPDLPVHASTQMTITGVYGARQLAALGADRIVTARELSLEEIARIHRETDIEIETFVHGALCYCYSGQCLFSSLIGGRSGNRGRCAQTCRLPYEVKQDSQTLNKKNEKYGLSLKDLCTLDIIPDIIEAGVYSMKIEGRMKSPRYTAGVVSIYRKYTDLYLERGRDGYRVEEKDRRMLLDLFDRGGFTEGYYRKHNGRDMSVWKEKPAFREGNQELFEELDRTYVDGRKQEKVEGSVHLKLGEPARLTLSLGEVAVTVEGETPDTAQSQPVTEEKLKKQLMKTGNTPFVFRKLETLIEGTVFLPVQALNELRRKGTEALYNAVLTPYYREVKEPPDSEALDLQCANKEASGNRTLSVSLENPEVLPVILENEDISRVYLEAAEFAPEGWSAAAEACRRAGKQCMLMLPRIFRTEAGQFFDRHKDQFLKAGFDGVLVRSMEEIGYLKEIHAEFSMVFDYGMYVMNRQAGKMMKAMGASELTMPVELNSRELEALNCGGELIVYGRLPMMVTAQCILKGVKGCEKRPGLLNLKDRMGKEFPVKNHCVFCYNTIYNEAPVSLLGQEAYVDRIGPASVRLQFTTESVSDTKKITEVFADSFLKGKASEPPFKNFTRGHFKRGVE